MDALGQIPQIPSVKGEFNYFFILVDSTTQWVDGTYGRDGEVIAGQDSGGSPEVLAQVSVDMLA